MRTSLVALRPAGALGSPALLRRSPTWRCPFQPNLTSLTNQRNRDEAVRKYGSDGAPRGIPRVSRLAARPISVLHETAHVMVCGRNFCNGFSNNQYLLVNKRNKECVFVDACDDWPDDWAAFLSASGLRPTHFFLTHCHVDCIINLSAFLRILESHLGVQVGIMWCQAEQPWVDAFPRACHRYGRAEESTQPLPMFRHTLFSYNAHALGLPKQQRAMEEAYARRCERILGTNSGGSTLRGGAARGTAQTAAEQAVAPPPPLSVVRTNDILLSCATNRVTSFYDFGPHNLLHYVFTPGHSPGHMMLSLPREKLLFTGDVLFYGKIGRVDLPWAAGEKLAESLLSLESYPDATVLLPGHGRLTTLGRERRENPALRALYERRAIGMQEVSVGYNEGYL